MSNEAEQAQQPIGWLCRSKLQMRDAEKAFPGKPADYLWKYTHGTKDLTHFEKYDDLEIVRVFAAPQPTPAPQAQPVVWEERGLYATLNPEIATPAPQAAEALRELPPLPPPTCCAGVVQGLLGQRPYAVWTAYSAADMQAYARAALAAAPQAANAKGCDGLAASASRLYADEEPPSREAIRAEIDGRIARAARAAAPQAERKEGEFHGFDDAERVFFYEQDFYVLSNFSSFTLEWKERRFDTSEAAYHWEKFVGNAKLMSAIQYAPSAHEAFKIAEQNRPLRREDWDSVKVGIMLDILRAKAQQHEYVRRKLLATGTRELIENSWRDDFWGWGPNRDGKNILGILWMQVRAELRGIGAQQEGGK